MVALLLAWVVPGRPAGAVPPSDRLSGLRVELFRVLTGHGQRNVTLSAHVLDLGDGRTVFDHDADKPMIPASVLKLVVSAAAFDRLGPEHPFVTRLAVSDRDLIIIGGGDPTLGDAKLARQRGERPNGVLAAWAEALLKRGIRRIPGHLLIDDSIFDATQIHVRWPADQYQEWYEAPVGGLNYADNCIEIEAVPGGVGNRPALVMTPQNAFMSLLNRASSGGRGSPVARRSRDAPDVVVTGAATRRTALGPIAVTDAGFFFAAAFRSELETRGITIAGSTERRQVVDPLGRLPAGVKLVAEHRTPLIDALQRACTDSLALMAECALKTLGVSPGRAGSWASGTVAVGEYLRQLGVAGDYYVIDDGSGLSRQNRLTARAVTTVLAAMNRHAGRDRFRSILAQPGEPGTLKRRLRWADTKNRVWAKTGFINGVRTLAGYVRTSDGGMFAFAFLYNDARATLPLTRAQDEACRRLAAWPNVREAAAPSRPGARPGTKPKAR